MPPRRRRPVQPATRVRLPRPARPRPGATLPPGETPAAETPLTETLTGTGETPTPAAGEAAGEAPVAGDAAESAAWVPGDETAAGPQDEAAEPEGEDADREPASDDGQSAAGRTDSGRGAAAPRWHRLAVPASLAAVAVILGGLAAWFSVQAGNVGSGADTQNIALTNAAATRQVNQAIDAAINTIFSYDYADTAKTREAAAQLLTGKARQQYDALFKLVQQDAPREKLVLTTKVTSSGVRFLTGNQAQLLIFINQSDTSNAARKTTDAGAMFTVNAVRQDGRWKIDNINDFSGT